MNKLTALFAATTSALVMSVATAQAGSPAKVWLFDQTAYKQGHVIVRVAPNAIRLDKLAAGISILCVAPDWKVYIFNEKKRIVCERTFDDWLQHGLYVSFFDNGNDGNGPSNYVLHEKLLFKGMPVVRGTIMEGEPKRLKAQFMMAPGIVPDPHAVKLLRRLYDLDLPPGMVLSWMGFKAKQVFMQSDTGDRGWVHEISTNAMSQIPLVAKDFAPPTNFKHVKNSEVVVGENGDNLSDFLGKD